MELYIHSYQTCRRPIIYVRITAARARTGDEAEDRAFRKGGTYSIAVGSREIVAEDAKDIKDSRQR